MSKMVTQPQGFEKLERCLQKARLCHNNSNNPLVPLSVKLPSLSFMHTRYTKGEGMVPLGRVPRRL
jgi:hypothetical protein